MKRGIREDKMRSPAETTTSLLSFISDDYRLSSWKSTKLQEAFTYSDNRTAIMPVTNFAHPDLYTYQTGFDSYHG